MCGNANVQIADEANEQGKFTAFAAYEWTSTPNSSNMHRNIFFKDSAKVPEVPFSSFDSQAPEDLWAWMDEQRKKGIELLAISHNANLSDGLMYPTEVDYKGRPIDKAWADARERNERLTEIKQIKGASETHPLLSPTTNSPTSKSCPICSVIRRAASRIFQAATSGTL